MMDYDQNSQKADRTLLHGILTTVVGGLIVGVLLLYIEHNTGIFATSKPDPVAHSKMDLHRQKMAKKYGPDYEKRSTSEFQPEEMAEMYSAIEEDAKAHNLQVRDEKSPK